MLSNAILKFIILKYEEKENISKKSFIRSKKIFNKEINFQNYIKIYECINKKSH
jgi:hypothetical protein